LDKLLVSRIRSLDKRKARNQYQISVRTRYI
jgi:hypothetical protein